MLPCGHEKIQFGVPLCSHLRTCREPWLNYVKWYTGSGINAEFICVACAEAREKGLPVDAEYVCAECFDYATKEVGDLVRTGGQPEVRISLEHLDNTLKKAEIPNELGRIVDIAPISHEPQSVWLLLAEDGRLFRFDAQTGNVDPAGVTSVQAEVPAKPFRGRSVARRLHVSGNGKFAAAVNDYGRHGQVIDLRSGETTMSMDAGNYHPETVPFSFAFARWQGRAVAIHRTAWNRLDVSDPSNGCLLSDRGPTSYRHGQERPPHYLDYFHGAVYVSPGGTHILDDGWVWHPVGIPVVWSIEQWLSQNVWESEDGATRKEVCARDGSWDLGMAWLDENTVAVGGIGDDDVEMVDGARIFDITSTGKAGRLWRSDWLWAREVTSFGGPAGRFFSDGKSLYSSSSAGLSRWDVKSGARTGYIENFHPTHYHAGARDLAQLADGGLLRLGVR